MLKIEVFVWLTVNCKYKEDTKTLSTQEECNL